MKILEKGTIIELTAEEYEDYYIISTVEILETFDYMEILDQYLAEFDIIPYEAGQFDYHLFVNYLSSKGLLRLQQRIDLPTLHIGSYGCPTLYK